MAEHSGVLRTFKRLVQPFYWPSMYQFVQEYVTRCDICQKTQIETFARRITSTISHSMSSAIKVEPKKILDMRWIKAKKFVEERLVKWKLLPIEDAIWEDIKLL
ncbi:Transposon Ty3 gag-pol polyprotein [Melia azedarach]|uniref:Transposon Ty3 gag-pol polyprotein n=1 Tax=Melia azedarach TaxID=155640 RepID=A0ACC1Y6L0_MELAZ|nr:Transposon Ty3 gag-pol polyprotein [Melia azedarach]